MDNTLDSAMIELHGKKRITEYKLDWCNYSISESEKQLENENLSETDRSAILEKINLTKNRIPILLTELNSIIEQGYALLETDLNNNFQ